MILKYISFLIGLTWSYSLIKTQSIFSKKAGLLFKIFISKVSWFTFLAAIYFGYKNFQIKFVLLGATRAEQLIAYNFESETLARVGCEISPKNLLTVKPNSVTWLVSWFLTSQ